MDSLSNSTVVLDSLTDVLEFIYQEKEYPILYGCKEGFVYIVNRRKSNEPEPEKKWSL